MLSGCSPSFSEIASDSPASMLPRRLCCWCARRRAARALLSALAAPLGGVALLLLGLRSCRHVAHCSTTAASMLRRRLSSHTTWAAWAPLCL